MSVQKGEANAPSLPKSPPSFLLPFLASFFPDNFREPFEDVLSREAAFLVSVAKAMFEHLCRKYPGRFQGGQLRTLQFKQWRVRSGPEREVMFPQVYDPGWQCQSDFTHMGSLNVTTGGRKFDHHTTCRLTPGASRV